MSLYCSSTLQTQNDLLMNNLREFYKNTDYVDKIIRIINGETRISLRIVDWFVTNYSKKNYTVYDLHVDKGGVLQNTRFKVYNDYKLKLKAYSKKRFDPFCRWDRIDIPYNDNMYMETTIGQLNFFKWALQHKVIDYIEQHYKHIEQDMNNRNSTSKRKDSIDETKHNDKSKTRKKREE